MAFNLVWDPVTQTKVPNTSATGPVPPPETGVIAETDGDLKVANQAVFPAVPPVTPVEVILPSPNEPIIGRDGKINHNWWRFFNQLYRRTGGHQDNVNRILRSYIIAGSPDALAFTGGGAPTLDIEEGAKPTAGSATLSGQLPLMFNSSPVKATSSGSATIADTGDAPLVTNTS
jgi:hypothetical protein